MTREEIEKKMKEHDVVNIIYHGYTYGIYTARVRFEEDGFKYDVYSYYVYKYISAVESNIESLDSVIQIGSDPEFFFVKDGEVVPSKEIAPRHGDVIQDGFQVELNPSSSACRESAATYIDFALQSAASMAMSFGAEISLAVGHTITDTPWKKLTMDERRFGCSPTSNIHEKTKRITGVRERFRSAGGHIHLGGGGTYARNNVVRIVTLLDILCGNTCVLVDRDESNARRRKIYGRAGEHRLKPYGIEYRVPSNFWLRHYVLWSMVSGLARNAYTLAKQQELAQELIDRVDMKKVREAINTNDKDLALETFKIVIEWMSEKKIHFRGGFSISLNDKFLDWVTQDDPIAELNVPTAQASLDSWGERSSRLVPGFEKFLYARNK